MFDVGDSQAASRHWASIPQCPELYAGTRLVLKLLIHIQSSTVVGGMPCTSYLSCVEDYLMKLEMNHDNISDRLLYQLVSLSSRRLQRESIIAC